MSKVKAVSTGILAILGLVVAIVSLLFSAIPCIGYYALIPSVVSLILAVTGWVYLKKNSKNVGVAVVATLFALVGIASSVYQYMEFKEVFETKERIENSVNHFGEKLQNEAEDAVIDYTKEKINDYLTDDEKKADSLKRVQEKSGKKQSKKEQ